MKVEREKWNHSSILFWKLLKWKITSNYDSRYGLGVIKKLFRNAKDSQKLFNSSGIKIYNTHALLNISSACHENT